MGLAVRLVLLLRLRLLGLCRPRTVGAPGRMACPQRGGRVRLALRLRPPHPEQAADGDERVHARLHPVAQHGHEVLCRRQRRRHPRPPLTLTLLPALLLLLDPLQIVLVPQLGNEVRQPQAALIVRLHQAQRALAPLHQRLARVHGQAPGRSRQPRGVTRVRQHHPVVRLLHLVKLTQQPRLSRAGR